MQLRDASQILWVCAMQGAVDGAGRGTEPEARKRRRIGAQSQTTSGPQFHKKETKVKNRELRKSGFGVARLDLYSD